MIDQEPQGYKFKHSKRIYLDGYHGVANDLMQLNDPVADGFMKVSDMRSDVVIIRKPQDRALDYDEIGFVRVAKFLKMPRLDFWHKRSELLQTKKEGDLWHIAINDQELADQVARTGDNHKKFDERFVDAFQAEVNKGLTACLRREKLFNGGKYNLGFFISYHGLLGVDLAIGSTLLAASALSGNAKIAAEAVGIVAAGNIMWNAQNLLGAGLSLIETWIDQKLSGSHRLIKPLRTFTVESHHLL